MQTLTVRSTKMPYHAAIPWPRVYTPATNQQDWIESIFLVESWLETYIGPHWDNWAWTGWSLVEQVNYCGVSFKYDRDRTLFLLQWSDT